MRPRRSAVSRGEIAGSVARATQGSVGALGRNPWVALDVATDPVAYSRVLRRAHERGVAGADGGLADIRDLVVQSWRRSVVAGVAPEASGAPIHLGPEELEAARAKSPLGPAIEAILGTLASVDGDARHVVAIADADANLLWVTGDVQTVERARAMRFQEGATWSEAAVGTNALGIARKLDHSVQIFSAEHFVAAVHGWTCCRLRSTIQSVASWSG